MKKSRILVISQYFYPEPFRINDMCTEWVKRGYDVTVVTGIPNYPEGKFYPGYGLRKKRKEVWNGIKIVRLPLIPRGHTSLGMIANYASFTLSGFFWAKRTGIEADYVFTFEVSPMTQALLGVWYCKKRAIPNYLYVQDLWPENVEIVTGIHSPLVLRPIGRMVDYIYKHCDQIFATSPSFVKNICKRGAEKGKVHYWPQYAEEFYVPSEGNALPEIGSQADFKIIFTGNIGIAQGLQILPETAQLLKDEPITFVMVGDGRYLESFSAEVKKRGVADKFCMIPRKPAEQIPKFLAACDAAFLSFQNEELWKMTIPAKLQSYMACGMPVIASAQGEAERIIREAQCGMCCEIGSAKALAEAILEMRKADLIQMGYNSRRYFEEHFDKKELMDQMENYFHESVRENYV